MKFLLRLIGAASLILTVHAHPDPSHTLSEIETHLADSPNDPELLKRKAELFLRTGHFRHASQIAERALAISPDDPAILTLQAHVADARGNLEEAINLLLEVNRRFPRFSAAWKILARLRHESGSLDDAITAKLKQLDTGDQVAPGDFLAASAWLLQRGQPGDTESAIVQLDRGVAMFDNIIEFQRNAIRLECSLARFPAALRRVDTLVSKHRPSVEFSLLRADIHEAAGNYSEAASACDSAISLLDAEQKGPSLASLRETISNRKAENFRKL